MTWPARRPQHAGHAATPLSDYAVPAAVVNTKSARACGRYRSSWTTAIANCVVPPGRARKRDADKGRWGSMISGYRTVNNDRHLKKFLLQVLYPPHVGSSETWVLNNTHGTRLPVEEPPTASILEIPPPLAECSSPCRFERKSALSCFWTQE